MASTPKRRIKNPKHSSQSPLLSSIEPAVVLLPSKPELFKLVVVLFIAVCVAVGCNYAVTFFNRQLKPFCNSDTEFDYHISDICESCPSHGICSEGKLECMSGYRRYGRTCLEDGDLNEMAKNLAKVIESRACESYSQFLCNGLGKVWVQRDELWNDMDKENATCQYAKQKAMEIVGYLLETKHTDTGIKELKCPDLLVEQYKPLTCSIRLWILEHALLLVACCVLLIGFGLMLQRVRRRHYLSVRAEEVYEQVCDILEEHALTSRTMNGESEPWIVASWLRDHVLIPRERRDPVLWKKVEDLVQEDSRLDRYPKMLKGEPKVVWEWQGSLRSSGKKKKNDNINKQKLSEESNMGCNQNLRRLKPGEVHKC